MNAKGEGLRIQSCWRVTVSVAEKWERRLLGGFPAPMSAKRHSAANWRGPVVIVVLLIVYLRDWLTYIAVKRNLGHEPRSSDNACVHILIYIFAAELGATCLNGFRGVTRNGNCHTLVAAHAAARRTTLARRRLPRCRARFFSESFLFPLSARCRSTASSLVSLITFFQAYADNWVVSKVQMTTRRPTFSSNKYRPLSAIFLGSISTPSHIPALPEPPPSPGAESNGSSSGLPSPPATNSTGSGSTGDDTTNFGSVRQRPVSYSQTPPSPPETGGKTTSTMSNRTYNTETIYRSTTNINEDNEGDDDNDNDNDDGEDNTARLDRRRASKSPSENSLALQRVKSLTQRNRMVSNI